MQAKCCGPNRGDFLIGDYAIRDLSDFVQLHHFLMQDCALAQQIFCEPQELIFKVSLAPQISIFGSEAK